MGDERPDWLPEGWTVGVKFGGFGAKVKYYTHPTNGVVFYSKPAVLRYLNGEVNTPPQKRSKVKHSKVKQDKVKNSEVNQEKSSPEAEGHSLTEIKVDGRLTRSKAAMSERNLRSRSKDATANVPDDCYVEQTDNKKSPVVKLADMQQLLNSTQEQASKIENSKEGTENSDIVDGDQGLKSELKSDMPEEVDNLRKLRILNGEKTQKENISANQSITSGSNVVDKPETKNSEEKAQSNNHTGDQQCVGKRRKSTSSLPRRQPKRCADSQSGKSCESKKTRTGDESKHLTGLKEPKTLPVQVSWIEEPKSADTLYQNVKNVKQPDLCVEDYPLEHLYIQTDDLPMEYLYKIGNFPPSVSLNNILDYPCMRFAVKTLLREGPIAPVSQVQPSSVLGEPMKRV